VLDADYVRQPSPGGGSGLKIHDVLYILWRHKWKISFFTVLGIGGAVAIALTTQVGYQSTAKILVKYVVEGTSKDLQSEGQVRSPDSRGESIMSSEIEILTSEDLARAVARDLEPTRILGLDAASTNEVPAADLLNAATRQVQQSIRVEAPRRSSVILVTYTHSDPNLAPLILRRVIETYRLRHVEIHRGGLEEAQLQRRSDTTENELTRVERDINRLRSELRVTSLEDAIRTVSARLANLETERALAERQLEAQRARVRQLEEGLAISTPNGETNAATEVPPAVMEQYRTLAQRLEAKRLEEATLLRVWTPESAIVSQVRQQIEGMESEKLALENTHPRLVGVAQPVDSRAPARDLVGERARIAEYQATLALLATQIKDQQDRINEIVAGSSELLKLERRRDVLATNLYYFDSRLEQRRFDDVLTAASALNIQVVQEPSLPFRNRREALMTPMAASAFGGLAFGLLLAFLIELVFDQRIRKPSEVEIRLGMPLMLTVPRVKGLGRVDLPPPVMTPDRHLPSPSPIPILPSLMGDSTAATRDTLPVPAPVATKESESSVFAPWHAQHALRAHFEALRDRLMLYFQLNRMMHKPKLVAVTGCGEGAGTTTMAAGLAAALSETGEGSVLLVDMNLGKGGVHPFFRGRPKAQLTQVLDPDGREEGQVQENLFVATMAGDSTDPNLPRPVPKRFSSLMPKMRASDYDFIIFDMPPISETSATVALAASMDQVLLVLEGDKTTRPEVKRANQLLSRYGAKVTGIFNKHKPQGASWLTGEA
jgi:polysaccharide biosynthesis transport protein